MIETGLKDKVVLITGANNPHGIGVATARACLREGARVFLHGYRPGVAGWGASGLEEDLEPGEEFYRLQGRKPLEEVLQSFRESGMEADGLEGDLSEPALVARLFERAEESLGPVHVLVNNAAAWEADTFIPTTQKLKNEAVELWTDRPTVLTGGSVDRLFAVNTRAPALMMAEFARRHVERGSTWGRIINISTAGSYVFPSEVSYGASKAALEAYTRSAAIELGQFGITVNTLCLGPVQTGWITPALEAHVLPSIPMARVGRPDDVAHAILFLASTHADWMTGQTIFVGGGHGM